MEIDNASTFIADDFNLVGHSGLSNAQAFSGFTPGATDLTATSDGAAPKALGAILDTILADNGGPTKTHALFAGSPAIDAVETGCPPPATDQRGVSRTQEISCDIGAFEGAIPRTADLAIGLTDAPDPVPVDGQLLYTFTVRNDGLAAATGVQVTDRLPEGMVFTSSQGECGGTQTVICELARHARERRIGDGDDPRHPDGHRDVHEHGHGDFQPARPRPHEQRRYRDDRGPATTPDPRRPGGRGGGDP